MVAFGAVEIFAVPPPLVVGGGALLGVLAWAAGAN